MRLIVLSIILLYFSAFSQSVTSNISKDFILVEGGSFIMGTEDGSGNESPAHKVTLNDFYISKYELTQGEWKELMSEMGCKDKGARYPVYHITLTDAVIYCNKRSIKEGLKPCYLVEGSPDVENADLLSEPPKLDTTANGYRLPTEAEWEYAARGGKLSKGYLYSGSNEIDEVAWYEENADSYIQEVGTKKPNELGIFDMSGNADEWVWDKYEDDFYEKSPEFNPIAREGFPDMYRGGCVAYGAGNCRVFSRMYYENPTYIYVIGVRLVRSK